MRTVEKEAADRAFEVLAYCFMPNHVNLLVAGATVSSRLKPFMEQFKQIAGFAFKQERGVQLWHRSYHDRVLRREESIESVSAYIWGNPVRDGLVQRLLGEAGLLHDKDALGGQTVRSVRTDPGPP